MLSNAFEWERLTHPTPTDEMVARRKAIVCSVLATFDSDQDVGAVLRLVSAALTGLSPAIAADVEYGKVLTEATKGHHEAFPSLLSENALDLQLTACLAVGEVLTRPESKGIWRELPTAVAGVCLSTAGLMPVVTGLHLQSVHSSLLAASRELIARTAKIVRKRLGFNSTTLDEISPAGDVASFWGQLKPILATSFETLSLESAIDREELEVLWWLYNRESVTFEKKLSDMGAYDVAFAASIELVDRALCPAPSSLNGIIQGLVARAGKKPDAAGKALESIVGTWTSDIIGALVPEDDEANNLVTTWPKVLPLTWIANKIAAAGVPTGWEQEFTSATGLSASLKITPALLTNQVFAERTAQRLLFPFQGDRS
jgi:hypothetical protein